MCFKSPGTKRLHEAIADSATKMNNQTTMEERDFARKRMMERIDFVLNHPNTTSRDVKEMTDAVIKAEERFVEKVKMTEGMNEEDGCGMVHSGENRKKGKIEEEKKRIGVIGT